ncbi:hypothetical protein [Nocardioides speluncae]|uniref:hypothetical protein n=1 Tax=Nocardioides speluncae TaxID=2670337 RepID=UPI000D690C6B|nr:hypothetical protein [Nocardioides speluncae]
MLSRPRASLDAASCAQYDELTEIRREQSHPMMPHLVDLESDFDSDVTRPCDPVELVAYGLAASDYWAGHALRWLDQGVPAGTLAASLKDLEGTRSRPQALRHQARRLRRSAG